LKASPGTAASRDWLALQPPEYTEQYGTATVERGPLSSAVTARGTVGVLLTVKVGAQVPGPITVLNGDFQSEVRRGQTPARIDPAPYELRVVKARADVDAARAALSVAENGVAATHVLVACARTEALHEAERRRALVGASNGAAVEIIAGALEAGDQVVIGASAGIRRAPARSR
jgi:multidrug resistance efflux pump